MEILQDILELFVIMLYKVSICKASSLVKYVVVRLWIELVQTHHGVLSLNFIFYNKSNVTEW